MRINICTGKGKQLPGFTMTPQYIIFSLYTYILHCILTFSYNLRAWRRKRLVADRARVVDAIFIVFLFFFTLQTVSRDVTSI